MKVKKTAKKTKRAKRTWRWVTRGQTSRGRDVYVEVWSTVTRPFKKESNYRPKHFYYVADNLGYWSMSCREFKALFGTVPSRGQCIKVEFSGKVVK